MRADREGRGPQPGHSCRPVRQPSVHADTGAPGAVGGPRWWQWSPGFISAGSGAGAALAVRPGLVCPRASRCVCRPRVRRETMPSPGHRLRDVEHHPLLSESDAYDSAPSSSSEADGADRVWFIRDGCGVVCAVLTWLLVVYADFVVTFVMLLPSKDFWYAVLNGVSFNCLAVLALSSHLRTMLTDPVSTARWAPAASAAARGGPWGAPAVPGAGWQRSSCLKRRTDISRGRAMPCARGQLSHWPSLQMKRSVWTVAVIPPSVNILFP